MAVENGGNGQEVVQLVNRLNESRSPYVSPHTVMLVMSRPTLKTFKLRSFSYRSVDT